MNLHVAFGEAATQCMWLCMWLPAGVTCRGGWEELTVQLTVNATYYKCYRASAVHVSGRSPVLQGFEEVRVLMKPLRRCMLVQLNVRRHGHVPSAKVALR